MLVSAHVRSSPSFFLSRKRLGDSQACLIFWDAVAVLLAIAAEIAVPARIPAHLAGLKRKKTDL